MSENQEGRMGTYTVELTAYFVVPNERADRIAWLNAHPTLDLKDAHWVVQFRAPLACWDVQGMAIDCTGTVKRESHYESLKLVEAMEEAAVLAIRADPAAVEREMDAQAILAAYAAQTAEAEARKAQQREQDAREKRERELKREKDEGAFISALLRISQWSVITDSGDANPDGIAACPEIARDFVRRTIANDRWAQNSAPGSAWDTEACKTWVRSLTEVRDARRRTATRAFVEQHMDKNALERFDAGVLGEGEIDAAVTHWVFRDAHAAGLRPYDRLTRSDVSHNDECMEPQVSFTSEVWDGPLTADDWEHLKVARAYATAIGATVTVRCHTGKCCSCDSEENRWSLEFCATYAGRTVTRRFSDRLQERQQPQGAGIYG